jgi:hypothetical protein
MAGQYDSFYHQVNCPCNDPPGLSPSETFIGSNYFCESGNPNNFLNYTHHQLYTDDPLWDGEGCGSQETPCCMVPGLPWFHRDYGNVTSTDHIELRVCGNQGTTDEDTPISYYEIYIK